MTVPTGWVSAKTSHGLLQAQRHAALGAVDLQNHDVDFLAGRDDLAGVDVLLGPGHFRNVDQTLDARFQFHECTVIGDVRDAAVMDRPQREAAFDRIPRIGLQLLHAKRDAVGFLVDLDDLDLDGLADRQDFRRVVDAAPGHVGHVEEAVNAAEVNERTIFGDVLDHAVDRLTFVEVADDFGALFRTAFLEDRAAGDDDIAPATVHLEDLERLLHAHERAGVAHGADVNLRAGKECNGAAEIDGEAALDAAEDGAIDALFRSIGLFKAIPGFFTAGFLAADDSLATRVFHAVEIDLDLVAHADVGLFTGIREFFKIDAAFHLVADIDDGLARLDGDDLALDDRALFGRVDLEAFLQEGFEFFHSVLSAHAVSVPFQQCYGPCGCLRRS
jgi:hypothetical protein